MSGDTPDFDEDDMEAADRAWEKILAEDEARARIADYLGLDLPEKNPRKVDDGS